jgi:glycolate oxidase FAD binding subunit
MPQQSPTEIATELAAIAGVEHIRVNADAVSVAPSGIAELSAIMRYANEHSLSVTPVGAGTKQGWGNSSKAAIELRMERFNAVKEHVWQDMTATVDAGTPWAAMQAVLKQHGQCVALDPLWPETATVGGIVATNDSGAMRLKYGSLRDLIIGMTIVLADGTIAKTGGKVVKNVAGYDLHKLMTGAFGTLGVIAEVTFRLHAAAANTRSFSIHAEQAEPLGELLLQISGSQLSLEALQLRTLTDGFCLDVCLATMPLVMTQQLAELSRFAGAHGLRVNDAATDIWNAREAEFSRNGPDGFTIKAVMLPTAIAHFSSMVRKLSGTSVTQAGGIMTASFDNAAAESLAQFRREVESAGGHLTLLKQPFDSSVPMHGEAAPTLPLMQKIKQQFDPNRILNPGRFLDGI